MAEFSRFDLVHIAVKFGIRDINFKSNTKLIKEIKEAIGTQILQDDRSNLQSCSTLRTSFIADDSTSNQDLDSPKPSTSKQLSELNSNLRPDESKIRQSKPKEILLDNPIDLQTIHNQFNERKFRNEERAPGQLRRQDERRRSKIEQFLLSRRIEINVSSLPLQQYILGARTQLNANEIKVCAIHVKKCSVLTNSGETKSLPIWISIVDEQANVVIDKLCRYPKDTIKDIGTEFHGLVWDDIKGADHFATVREQVMDVLTKYDRIIVAGEANVFFSMGLTSDDWNIICDKVRDVNDYYSYTNGFEQISLRCIAFCLFGRIIQDGAHSPVTNAQFALLAYLVDYENFEKVHASSVVTRPFIGKGYPRNVDMAWLINRIMRKIKNWPEILRKKSDSQFEMLTPFDHSQIEINPNFRPRKPYTDVPFEPFKKFACSL